MKKHILSIVVFAAVTIGIIFAVLPSQSKMGGAYYNAVLVPADDSTIYAQEIQSDAVAATIRVSKVETPDFLPERYRLTVSLTNTGEAQYAYAVNLMRYSSSLICNTSNTEVTYSENYSSGSRNNANTIYYFVPDHKRGEATDAGELSFDLQRNDLTADMGIAEIWITVDSPYMHRRIATIGQQICFDLAP